MQFSGCKSAVKYVCSQGSASDLAEKIIVITKINISFCYNDTWNSKFMALEKPAKNMVNFLCPTLRPP